MANWASVSYTIEGPISDLNLLMNAIQNAPVEDYGKRLEVDVLSILNIKLDNIKHSDGRGLYLRGSITSAEWGHNNTTIILNTEEAWGVVDFKDVLKVIFPDIKIYYVVEEPNDEVYATNDVQGKYYPDRFYVDACIEGDYDYNYFSTSTAMYQWLSEITGYVVHNEETLNTFNSDYENEGLDDENYIHVHEFKVIS